MLKKLYAYFLKCLSVVATMDFAKKFDSMFRFHRHLDLKHPKTLADKVAYLELHVNCNSDLVANCTDKYAVREYVSEKGLASILVPVVGGPWKSTNEIEWENLPHQFVLKATHGCKMNYVVNDRDQLNIQECEQVLAKWLHTSYGAYSLEPHYLRIQHRLYAEYFLKDAENMIDYKFHCFNGKPEFVLVCRNRSIDSNGNMSLSLLLKDLNWMDLDGLQSRGGDKKDFGVLEKPKEFDYMVEVAKKLSEDFDFVRVDLYEIEGNVLFGELTFSPACCVFPYFTDSFIDQMGGKLFI